MAWHSLRLVVPREQVSRVSDVFERYDAVSVTFSDAGDEPVFQRDVGELALWDETTVSGLFHADASLDVVRLALRELFGRELEQRLHHVRIDDQDWTRVWLDDFHPMRFGERLWIYPTGFEPPGEGEVAVRLDPGLAFGTGTHPTTRMCLQWLDAQAQLPESLIDYGCGSGVLAVAAALLGVEQVVGVDHDPQALIATRENAERNGVLELVGSYLPHEAPLSEVDCVMANILAGPLIDLAPTLSKLVCPGGSIVLSGILRTQAESVARAYERWFGSMQMQEDEGWMCLTATRRDP